MLVENPMSLVGGSTENTKGRLRHRPGRMEKINQALNNGEGRTSEIVLALVTTLGRNGVNDILNKSSGIDHRIENNILELVRVVRTLIQLEDQPLIDYIKSIKGFERTNLLNATPVRYLVKIHNYLIDCEELVVAKEVERAIDRNPNSTEYKKETVRREDVTTNIRLASGAIGVQKIEIVKYFPENRQH